MRKALVLSFAAHAALVAAVGPLRRSSASAALVPPEDRWTGTTAELPSQNPSAAGPLVDVSVEPTPNAPTPNAPAPPPAPPPVPVPAPAPAPVPVPAAIPVEAPRPKPAAIEHRPAPRTDAASDTVDRPKPAPKPKKARVASSGEGPASPGGGSNGTFGAEGPASVRDLGRAFTRAIPPACDADPVWATLPVGAVGKLEVSVLIDGEGHITGAEPRGSSQPKALVNVLRRTIPMLQAGTFALRDGAVSEGSEILELSAIVSDTEADEGAPNQLAFEYARGKGKARFTQSSGRHVEISVRVVRVQTGR